MKRRFAVSAAVSLLTLAFPIAGAGSLAACSEDTAPQAAAGGSAGSEAGAAGSDGTPAPSPTDVTCDGAKRLALPADFAQRGPWAVGARTVVVGGLVSEIWYPSPPGADAGQAKVSYDMRDELGEADQGKIPDEKAPIQVCDCVRDLPLDEAHGPYPIVAFFHGTATFRTQSLAQMTHWASRGFIVVATDHPNLFLADALANKIDFDGPFELETAQVLDAIKANEPVVSFLSGHVDFNKVASSGHSAGGGAATRWSYPNTRVKMPLSAGGTEPAEGLVSTLIMGGNEDKLIPATEQKKGYDLSPTKKRLVILDKAGHLAFSDICVLGRDQGGILQLALDSGITVPKFLQTLASDGCTDGQLFGDELDHVVNAITAATLEETLACGVDAAAALRDVKTTFPAEVASYEEAL
jgi:predicted dienelactone hydrolase